MKRQRTRVRFPPPPLTKTRLVITHCGGDQSCLLDLASVFAAKHVADLGGDGRRHQDPLTRQMQGLQKVYGLAVEGVVVDSGSTKTPVSQTITG